MKVWASLYGFFWLSVVQVMLSVNIVAGVSYS